MKSLAMASGTIVLAVAIPGAASHAATPEPVSVKGAVKVAGGESPVAGALVRLTKAGTTKPLERTSGKDGTFVFEWVRPGTYTVTVMRAGYYPIELADVEVRAGERLSLNVPIVPEVDAGP